VPQVLQILFGAAFTIAICSAFGRLLLRRFPLPLYRQEAALFSFVTGSACTQIVIFTLCAFHQARPVVLGALGVGVIGTAAVYARSNGERKSLPRPAIGWLVLFFSIYAAFFTAYFLSALAPEVSPDGSGYHLGNVYRMWQQHGFAWGYHSIYSHMPQGMEMLFLPAYTFGGPSAAALVHFAFFSALPLLMVCYGCRFGFPRAAIFAAVLVYAAPVCGITGISAYNDLALATVIYAGFYLLQLNVDISLSSTFILLGLLVGEAFAFKYTGALAVPFAAGLLLWKYRRAALRPLLLTGLAAALVAVPWLLRNWIWLGNPAAPFLNAWFPNPYYDSYLEHSYLADLARYPHFNHFWNLPLEFTLFGRVLPGFIGPVFLFAPVALLSLRNPHGRRLLLAAVVFASPIWFNAAVRFLVPALPFLSMAMGIAMAESWGVLPVLTVFHAVLCWPSVAPAYCAPWAWRLSEIPVRAALRLEPEAQFLQRRLSDYAWKEPVERLVPPDARIFTDSGRPEAYIHREMIVGYESLRGYQAQQILWRPLVEPSFRPFAAQKLKQLGVSYLLINDTDQVAGDLKNYSNLWGVTQLAVINGTRLYRIG
jgi:hypothetical protein